MPVLELFYPLSLDYLITPYKNPGTQVELTLTKDYKKL